MAMATMMTVDAQTRDVESLRSRTATLGGANQNLYLDFRAGVVPDEQLGRLRATGRVGRRLAAFYRRQNNRIKYITDPGECQDAESDKSSRLSVRIAVWASLFANVSLCILQLYAALTSHSLPLIATAIDSVFDIGSNIILLWVHRHAENLNIRTWPMGGARLETVGNVVYGSLMAAVNLVVVVESVHMLIVSYSDRNLTALHVPSLVAVAAALGVKVLLFFYCLPLRRASSQVQMLWEDHRNDIFINGFGLLMSAGGSKLIWYLDPMGGLVIGCAIIATWTWTLRGLYRTLAGAAAPQEDTDRLLYHAISSFSSVQKFRSFKVYHNGEDYAVEIHASLSADTLLLEAHTTATELRQRLEKLPRVNSVIVVLESEPSKECSL